MPIGRNPLGFLDKVIPKSLKSVFNRPTEQIAQGYRTFTEYSPAFTTFEGSLYEQAQTRAIIERIAMACSKLEPKFVTPDGSGGSLPRIQRLVSSNPNDMMTWPAFLKRVCTCLYVDTVAYIVPQYDERDSGAIVGLWPMKPSYAEVVDFEGEPWFRFHLQTGDVQAFPFYDVAIVTRFQLDSDIFGGGNMPLTPTLRLMDAQRQAEEIALQTGADIRFIGKVTTNMHEDDLDRYRDRFSKSNFGPNNKSALILHDNRIEDLKQVDPQHYTIDPEEMERVDKALYAYFGINEKILNNTYNEYEWAAFYESVVETFAIAVAAALNHALLSDTQLRKGNYIMFSSGYLEYSTPETKVKVISAMMDRGLMTVNEGRDVFQLNHIPGGDARMIRGEIYMIDENNNIIAESGGHSQHDTTWHDGWHDDMSDLDEPDDNE